MPQTNPHILNPEKWLDDHGDYLFTHARNRVADAETAEDLVQETFLSAWRARESFQGKASEKTWLVSILKNKIVDHYRKTLVKDEDQSGRKEVPLSFFSEDGHWQPEAVGHDWDSLASAHVESSEFFSVFQKCIEQMRGNAKAAFVLKYLDNEESEMICKSLDISPSNFWVIIHRAKLQLRGCLDKNWFNEI